MTVVIDGTTGVNTPGINGGQLAGMRNKIINGKMEIAQRGTSFAAIANGDYSLDRWAFGNTTAAVGTVTQNSNVPSSNEFQSSYRYEITTADTSIASGDLARIIHSIEGYNVRDLIGRTFTLSFWVRSSKTGTHCVAFRNSGADRSYVAEYTVSAANTWEQKSITVTGGLITSGTWNWTNGKGLEVTFVLAAGSGFRATAGAWQTSIAVATANQVNVLDTVGNIFAITGVQLEVGSVATPFEHRPYETELALCQRYYEALDIVNIAATAGAGSGGVYLSVRFRVTKRAVPSLTFAATSNFGLYGPAGALNPTSVGSDNTTANAAGVSLINASIAAGTTYRALAGQNVIFATAEL